MSQRRPDPHGAGHDRPAERVRAEVIHLDLGAELKKLRGSASYQRNDHASTTLVNRPGLGVVLIALPKGGHLKHHRAKRPILIRVLEGRVALDLEGQSLTMTRDQATALAPELIHSIEGMEDSAVLLTMGGAATG